MTTAVIASFPVRRIRNLLPVRARVLQLHAEHDGLTNYEAGQLMNIPWPSVAARSGELRDAGLLEAVGRRLGPSSNKSWTVWKITDLGRRKLAGEEDTPNMSSNLAFIGHNSRMDHIKRKIEDGHDRAMRGGQEWVEGSLELAAGLLEGRLAIGEDDTAFGQWLRASRLNYFSKDDRLALINLASDMELARTVLTETKSRSYQLIWRENKKAFRNVTKGPPKSKSTKSQAQKKTKMDAWGYAGMKIGDAVVADLKGTSLDNSQELQALVYLNRGAEEGAMTDEVRRLVENAIAGKTVSAMAEANNHKAPDLLIAWNKRMAFAWAKATPAQRRQLWCHMVLAVTGDDEKAQDDEISALIDAVHARRK